MSASAPVLQNSPYAATVGKPMRRPKVWVPPPGAFNEPDLPRFVNPGPGRYTPAHQHACLSTKPRVVATRFGSEDRFKYLGPQTALEPMQSGMVGGLFCPQSASGPGPSYLPSYDLVRPMARKSSFTVAVPINEGRGNSPGPGLYNPTDKGTRYNPNPNPNLYNPNPNPNLYNPNPNPNPSPNPNQRRNYTSGGGFLADDRHKYLGEIDPASLQPMKKCSPGPMYAAPAHTLPSLPPPCPCASQPPTHLPAPPCPYPSLPLPLPASYLPRPPVPTRYKPGRYCQGKRVTTVSFGGHGPGTVIKPPSLKAESPGPGSYTPGFSDMPRSQISSFRSPPKTNSSPNPNPKPYPQPQP